MCLGQATSLFALARPPCLLRCFLLFLLYLPRFSSSLWPSSLVSSFPAVPSSPASFPLLPFSSPASSSPLSPSFFALPPPLRPSPKTWSCLCSTSPPASFFPPASSSDSPSSSVPPLPPPFSSAPPLLSTSSPSSRSSYRPSRLPPPTWAGNPPPTWVGNFDRGLVLLAGFVPTHQGLGISRGRRPHSG